MSDNAVTAKAKAIYGLCLDRDDYNSLLHKNSIGAVAAFLKHNPRYEKTFCGVNENTIHRGQVETLLAKNIFETYMRLVKFNTGGREGFISYFIKKAEIEQLLKAVMYIDAGEKDGFLKDMPSYMMGYTSYNLMDAANAKNFKELLQAVSGSPYHETLRQALSGADIDIRQCGTTLYTEYYRWLYSTIDKEYRGNTGKELKNAILLRNDYDNILTAFRMRRFFSLSAEEIKKSLLPFYYKLEPAKFEKILRAPDASEKLAELVNKQYFGGKIDFNTNNPEIQIRRNDFRMYRKNLYYSQNDAVVFYSVMALFDIERSNIQKIIEGIRYGLEPAEIEELLII